MWAFFSLGTKQANLVWPTLVILWLLFSQASELETSRLDISPKRCNCRKHPGCTMKKVGPGGWWIFCQLLSTNCRNGRPLRILLMPVPYCFTIWSLGILKRIPAGRSDHLIIDIHITHQQTLEKPGSGLGLSEMLRWHGIGHQPLCPQWEYDLNNAG